MKSLLVVDNPVKARTVWSALSSIDPDAWVVLDYAVPPTDFPRKLAGGINSAGGFEPQLTSANPDRLSRILDVCKDVSSVYLCFDPTLEGEESAVYLLNAMSPYIDFSKIHRVRFGFLTKRNIQKALDKPASFDHFSAEKSETLRLLDRMVQFNVNTALGGKAAYESDIGLCSYYIMSLLTARYTQKRQHKQLMPEFRVAFKAENGVLVKSDEAFFQSFATQVAESCMLWLQGDHKIGNVTNDDYAVPAPELYNVNSLVLDCLQGTDNNLSKIVSTIVSMYHEGLITNPYSSQKVTAAYSANVTTYLKEFELAYASESPALIGILPIDIRLDMNKINKSYRPIYRKLWQRTLQAHGASATMRKTRVQFNVPEGHTATATKFSGLYFDVLTSGFLEFFNKVRRDREPDVLKDVVLEKQDSKNPSYYTERSLVEEMLPVFSIFDINKSLEYLKDAKFIRTGTSNLLIPTFRGLILSFAVLKHIPQLGQVSWIQSMLTNVSQPRNAARTALATAWLELKPAIQNLDKHKFVCSQPCPKCSSKLDVIFDKEREPYLFCEKTSTSGCGAVHSVLVNETGNILVFEPYPILRPCPKCELSNMRCHNGPYGLFVRCDSCGKTQPFE